MKLKEKTNDFLTKVVEADKDYQFYLDGINIIDGYEKELLHKMDEAKNNNELDLYNEYELELKSWQREYRDYLAELKKIFNANHLYINDQVRILTKNITDYNNIKKDLIDKLNIDDNLEEKINAIYNLHNMINKYYQNIFQTDELLEKDEVLPRKMNFDEDLGSYRAYLLLFYNMVPLNKQEHDIDKYLPYIKEEAKSSFSSRFPKLNKEYKELLNLFYSYMVKIDEGISLDELNTLLSNEEHYGKILASLLGAYSKGYSNIIEEEKIYDNIKEYYNLIRDERIEDFKRFYKENKDNNNLFDKYFQLLHSLSYGTNIDIINKTLDKDPNIELMCTLLSYSKDYTYQLDMRAYDYLIDPDKINDWHDLIALHDREYMSTIIEGLENINSLNDIESMNELLKDNEKRDIIKEYSNKYNDISIRKDNTLDDVSKYIYPELLDDWNIVVKTVSKDKIEDYKIATSIMKEIDNCKSYDEMNLVLSNYKYTYTIEVQGILETYSWKYNMLLEEKRDLISNIEDLIYPSRILEYRDLITKINNTNRYFYHEVQELIVKISNIKDNQEMLNLLDSYSIDNEELVSCVKKYSKRYNDYLNLGNEIDLYKEKFKDYIIEDKWNLFNNFINEFYDTDEMRTILETSLTKMKEIRDNKDVDLKNLDPNVARIIRLFSKDYRLSKDIENDDLNKVSKEEKKEEKKKSPLEEYQRQIIEKVDKGEDIPFDLLRKYHNARVNKKLGKTFKVVRKCSEKLNKYVKKFKKQLYIAALGTMLLGGVSININKDEPKKPKIIYAKEISTDNKDIIESKHEVKDEQQLTYKVGDRFTLKDGTRIFKSGYVDLDGSVGYRPLYPQDVIRYIDEIEMLDNNSSMVRVDNNDDLEEALNNGYKIVSVYSGIDGFYKIDDIIVNERGIKR